MDFQALFNENTFPFSDFQEFTVRWVRAEAKLGQQTALANAKLIS